MTAPARTGLDEAYFDVMSSAAGAHWWYQARRALVEQLLAGRARPRGTAVDVGCGVGHTLATLRSLGYRRVLGTDLSPYALTRRAVDLPVLVADARNLPLADGEAGCILALDVVEHIRDEAAALGEWRRVLAPSGTLVLTVPAYQWLFSDHDRWACHERRYTRGRLERAVRAAGFAVERSTYFNSFLVPPAVVSRKTPLRRWSTGSDESGSGRALPARVFGGLSRGERRLLRRVDVPFGLSVALVAVPAT